MAIGAVGYGGAGGASSLSAAKSSSAKKIYVGNDKVHEVFRAAVAAIPPLREKLEVLSDPLSSETRDLSVFGRDLRVTLLDGSQLIPYQLKQEIIKERMQSWFPIRGLIDDVSFGTGFGFHREFEGKALDTARKESIEHAMGRTAIEGGNCFVFPGPDARPRAILGINSLIISLLSLEEQHYFEENREALLTAIAAIESPADEFVLMARDRSIFEAKAALEDRLNELQKLARADPKYQGEIREVCAILQRDYGSRSEYRAKLAAPLTAADRASFVDLAKELQAKWEMGKELIAQELKIPFEKGRVDESLAVIFQHDFHIDLEMFVAKGKVFMNDETLVHETCASMRVSAASSAYLASYTDASAMRLKASAQIKALNAPILAKIGCDVAYVPGSYHTTVSLPVNFMNGITIEEARESYFITLGASDRRRITDSFQESFAVSLASRAPDIRVIFLESLEGVFKDTGGGLHCMTWEKL